MTGRHGFRCGVAAMLRMIAPLSFHVFLNGEEILPE